MPVSGLARADARAGAGEGAGRIPLPDLTMDEFMDIEDSWSKQEDRFRPCAMRDRVWDRVSRSVRKTDHNNSMSRLFGARGTSPRPWPPPTDCGVRLLELVIDTGRTPL